LDPAPLFLIGFMATGKSTVGPLLAERLGRRYVDLDGRIAAARGKDIPAIFAGEGEPAFRRYEASALADAAGERDVVVGCGGGTPCFGDNLARMRAAGPTVALLASLPEVLARAGSVATRPLLGQAERLYGEREAIYRAADICVDTGGRTPAAIADEAARRAALHLGDVAVRLGERSYPIHLAPLARVGALAGELMAGPAVVVTDANVAAAGHAGAVARALGAPEVVIPAGEAAKHLATVERVAGECVAAGLDRRGGVVAVGGGVVGDLAGFVAAVLYRGVRVAQVPTTLLAMVDSAVGGKTGVDLPAGKNLVGAFWQPRFVLADVATLETLPPRELAAAAAEIVKVGLLGDRALFELLETEGLPGERAELVRRCAAAKAAVVAADEREQTGARAALNLGHTVGHAIELASGYRLLHGEAVALGLVAAARVSARLGLCGAALEGRVAAALARCGLATDLSPWLRAEVLAPIGVDKKRRGARVRFIALEEVGRWTAVELEPEKIAALLLSS
jgi:3-dehydroquinate synthase